jgi:membrane protease YdiL (CAAX protease family)
MVFCYALWRTGSLWWGIGFHATWDWAQSYLFGVADSGNISVGRLFITHPQGKTILSGGADGPEGSLFASLALLFTLGAIHLASRGSQPAIEQQPEALPTVPTISPSY